MGQITNQSSQWSQSRTVTVRGRPISLWIMLSWWYTWARSWNADTRWHRGMRCLYTVTWRHGWMQCLCAGIMHTIRDQRWRPLRWGWLRWHSLHSWIINWQFSNWLFCRRCPITSSRKWSWCRLNACPSRPRIRNETELVCLTIQPGNHDSPLPKFLKYTSSPSWNLCGCVATSWCAFWWSCIFSTHSAVLGCTK